jgi:hypothetical protein
MRLYLVRFKRLDTPMPCSIRAAILLQAAIVVIDAHYFIIVENKETKAAQFLKWRTSQS